MGCRFFPNEMPDFVEEKEEEIATEDDSLMKLLSMPYSALSERLKRAGLDLKDSVLSLSLSLSLSPLIDVEEAWIIWIVTLGSKSCQSESSRGLEVVVETWGLSGQCVRDFSLYCGALGTAFLQFKAYQLTNNKDDLNLCSDIIKACDSLCSCSGFSHSSAKVLIQCIEDARDGTFLCGRAGVCALGAATAKQLGDEQLLTYHLSQFKEARERFLLMIFERYWGAAHGLAGIMHVLMHVKLNPEEAEEVKHTLKYIIKKQFPSGNFPSAAADNEDHLVHWCHSAPGIALTFLKAAEVFGDEEFLEAAVNAAEAVWNRGLTGWHLAKAFACFVVDRASKLIAEGEMHGGDNPYSLFEGIGGMAYLLLDMTKPTDAKFPGYEL
ncbi:hypothetical protein RHSIM_Rhsim06G0146700 [Rhododendron simsii]|uniref:Uncharacterized protein n=1 Tax=Rhododendron simsii TaxID=118357 RepID=A0A834H2H9_RHOSS|nr:hypothetical protein RHSIM_Rhsim06G0146700 [Rhododendron simsii]